MAGWCASLACDVVAALPATAEDGTALGPERELLGPFASNRYRHPRRKYWLRLMIEEAFLLGLGEVEYQVSEPQAHYTLAYDWSTTWEKVTWQKVGLDTFAFDNDQFTHPVAGMLTYQFARSNGFGLAASSTVTTVSAVLWKQFGEFQESSFLNSIVTTSFAGVSIGEATSQLASYLDAGRSTPVTQVLSFLVDPVRKVHDWIDGAEPLRTTNVDAFGLSRDVEATLTLWGGTVATRASSSERPSTTYGDFALGARSHIVNVPGFDDPGRSSGWWGDGNESKLVCDVQWRPGGLDDLYFLARVAPVGWFTKKVTGKGEDRKGQRFWVGPTVGFDYVLHDYDHLGNGSPPDRFSTSQLGLEFEHTLFFPHGRLETGLAIQGQFGPVQSLALHSYLTNAGVVDELPQVLRAQGFYWSLGVGATPAVQLRLGPVRVGGLARIDEFHGTYALQSPTQGSIAMRDWAVVADAWIGVLPLPALELAVGGRRRTRNGVLGTTVASRDEDSILTTATLTF
ncbi:MAG: DUF3943 domain-containing protein [Polyangiaceae bacterium]